MLHLETAPLHNVLSIIQLLAEKKLAMLEQSLYSVDLAKCISSFSSNLK